MTFGTWQSLTTPEGYLDMERHESDLRGSRGVFLAGVLMCFMGLCNMRNTLATIMEKRKAKQWARRRAALLSPKRQPSTPVGSPSKQQLDAVAEDAIKRSK